MRLVVYSTADGSILRNVSCPAADADKQAKAGEAWVTVPAPVDSTTHRVNLSTLEVEVI